MLIPYALDAKGIPVKITDVPTGIECGCICPACGELLVAKNRQFEGRAKNFHFAHHSGSGSCEGQLHWTAKHLLLQREQTSLAQGIELPIQWMCENCPCTHSANLLARTTRLELEQYYAGAIKPDITAFGNAGCPVCFQEIVDSHNPEPVTYEISTAERIPLVIIDVATETDLDRIAEESPLHCKVVFGSCECTRQRCQYCWQVPCDDANRANPLPHGRCTSQAVPHCVPMGRPHYFCILCRDCFEGDEHLHCECGKFPPCYCCHIKCQERDREHRHCKDCQAVVFGRARNGGFYRRCKDCEQVCRAGERAKEEQRQANERRKAECAEAEYAQKTAEWAEFNDWFRANALPRRNH